MAEKYLYRFEAPGEVELVVETETGELSRPGRKRSRLAGLSNSAGQVCLYFPSSWFWIILQTLDYDPHYDNVNINYLNISSIIIHDLFPSCNQFLSHNDFVIIP